MKRVIRGLSILLMAAMPLSSVSAEEIKFVNVTSSESGIEWIYLSTDVSESGQDKQHVEFPDAQPYIDENNRTQVPVRALAEAMGAAVDWDEASQTVTINDGNTSVSLVIGSDVITANGEETKMDTAAVIKDDRTYVPIRFVSEAMGYFVSNYRKFGTHAIINSDLADIDDVEITVDGQSVFADTYRKYDKYTGDEIPADILAKFDGVSYDETDAEVVDLSAGGMRDKLIISPDGETFPTTRYFKGTKDVYIRLTPDEGNTASSLTAVFANYNRPYAPYEQIVTNEVTVLHYKDVDPDIQCNFWLDNDYKAENGITVEVIGE